jgi:hypothetical protein
MSTNVAKRFSSTLLARSKRLIGYISARTLIKERAIENFLLDLFLFTSTTSKEQQNALLAHFSSFVFWSRCRYPAHSPGTYSSRNLCCCIPYGIVPQERITLDLRSGQFRRPNNEAR